MKLSKYTCHWCEKHRLHFVDVCETGATAGMLVGIKLACSNPGAGSDVFPGSCPDTTGACETEEEAEAYAAGLCEPI